LSGLLAEIFELSGYWIYVMVFWKKVIFQITGRQVLNYKLRNGKVTQWIVKRIPLLLLLRPFVQDYPGEPVPEETSSHLQLSWSPIILYVLPPSTTSQSILTLQCTYLTVFLHNLSPSLLWSTSWPGTLHFILHTFLHPNIVFFS